MFPNYKVFENRCIYFSIICFEPSRFVHFNKFCKRDQRTKTKKTSLHGKLTHTESISMHLFAIINLVTTILRPQQSDH